MPPVTKTPPKTFVEKKDFTPSEVKKISTPQEAEEKAKPAENVRLGQLLQENYNFLSNVLNKTTTPTEWQMEASRIISTLK